MRNLRIKSFLALCNPLSGSLWDVFFILMILFANTFLYILCFYGVILITYNKPHCDILMCVCMFLDHLITLPISHYCDMQTHTYIHFEHLFTHPVTHYCGILTHAHMYLGHLVTLPVTPSCLLLTPLIPFIFSSRYFHLIISSLVLCFNTFLIFVVRVYVYVTVLTWRSEDNFVASVPPFYCVAPLGSNSGCQAWHRRFYSLSLLTGPFCYVTQWMSLFFRSMGILSTPLEKKNVPFSFHSPPVTLNCLGKRELLWVPVSPMTVSMGPGNHICCDFKSSRRA